MFEGFSSEKSRYTKISEVTRKLNRKGLLRYGGIVESGGRPAIFYYRHKLPNHLWNHELGITDFIEALGWVDCRRGRDVDHRRADAELLINGNVYHLEWDTGSESKRQWERRIRQYDGEFTLLVVTRDEKRLQSLQDWSSPLEGSGYFTTISDALQTPYDAIWRSLDGDCYPLEKPID